MILSQAGRDNESKKIYCLVARQYEKKGRKMNNEDEYLEEKTKEVKSLENSNLIEIGKMIWGFQEKRPECLSTGLCFSLKLEITS